jgi:hypothetical protein
MPMHALYFILDFHGIVFKKTNTRDDALLGPGVNPLEGPPNVKLRKLGPKGMLPASNSKRG